MIDDEDSKVRRNLVAFCSMILVVTFLQVQPVKLIQEALKLPDLGIPPWKTWTLVTTSLVYLRYRFTTRSERSDVAGEPTRKDRPSWSTVWADHLNGAIEENLSREAERQILDRVIEPTGSFKEVSPFKRLVQTETSADVEKIGKPGQVSVLAYGASVSEFIPPTGTCKISVADYTLYFKDAGSKSTRKSAVECMFRLSWPRTFAVWSVVAARTVFTTEDGLTHNLPRLLTWLASACIAGQFACIAWVWWHSGTV